MLLGRLSIKKLGVVISIVHLKMKFPTDDGRIVTMAVNQEMAHKCYEDSLKVRWKVEYCVTTTGTPVESELDPRLVHSERRTQPVGEVNEILIDGRNSR